MRIGKRGHLDLHYPRTHPFGDLHPARRTRAYRATRRGRPLLVRALLRVNPVGEGEVAVRSVFRRRALVQNHLQRLVRTHVPPRNHPRQHRRRRTVPGPARFGNDIDVVYDLQAHREVQALLV